jgi:hypothetical protein
VDIGDMNAALAYTVGDRKFPGARALYEYEQRPLLCGMTAENEEQRDG